MEAQNQLALQELRDLHKVEVEHQTVKLQEELKKRTEELHKQELIIAELTSERQALATNLQGQSDQQLRCQEEIEMLKCQSEMLLEQQIGLLKDEFLTEKMSALQELEERFSNDLEKARAEHQMEKDRLMKQLEATNTEVLQLQDKVSSLTKDMAASQSQMDVLVQRRERENQEGEHLVAMLQSDVHAAQQERVHDSEYESDVSLDPEAPEFRSTVDSLIVAVNHALKVDDDSNAAPDHAVSFTRTKRSHKTFASHPDFLEIVKRHRERPDKRFTGKKELSGRLFGEKLDQLISDATGGKSKFLPQQRPKAAFQRQPYFRFRPFRTSPAWSNPAGFPRSDRSARSDRRLSLFQAESVLERKA
ncbi:unnamed protein product [Ranitomeya imitator]|uniref:Uncharacterized protein n=1 Tax=Ranitomeya imitator TaxID=111125 RepID=A0ABN9LZK6_9NEOB|nr:unnamed protein product [Ranitomeya imitator]